jgi:hypothetical protein
MPLFSSIKAFFHFHELLQGQQALNMGIIWLILVDVYKHFKIFNAQFKASKVGAYTCNVENSLHFKLGTNKP